MTISPALTPETISTLVAVGEPERHRAPLGLPVRAPRTPRSRRLRGRSRRRERARRACAARRRCRPAPACRPAGSPAGAGAQPDGAVAASRLDRRGRGDHRSARVSPLRRRAGHEARRRADRDARSRRPSGTDGDDLEPARIDDAQHGIGGRGFDEIAGVVEPLGDHAVEGRAHGRAAGDGFGRGQRRARLGERRLGVGDARDAFLDFPARGDAALEQLARARLRRPRRLERGLRRAPLRPAASGLRRASPGSRSGRARRPAARGRRRRAGSPRCAPPRARRRPARRPARA